MIRLSHSRREFMVLGLAFVLSFCSLVYEFLIAQTVSFFAANTVVWYSLTIGIFIGSMGLGAWFHACHPAKGAAWSRLFWVEVFLSGVGGSSVFFIKMAHLAALYFFSSGSVVLGSFIFFLVALLAAFGVGFLTGIELPLLMEMVEEGEGSRSELQARVLGMDYLGALAAGIAFPFLILPSFDLVPAAWSIALLNLGVAFAACLFFCSDRRRFLIAGWIGSFFLVALFFSTPVEKYFLNKYYFSFYDSGRAGRFFWPHAYPGQAERIRSVYQTIDLVHWPDAHDQVLKAIVDAFTRKFQKNPDLPRGLVFFLNGDFQFTSDFEDVYHETFAHVPIMANGRVPENVLVLGAGDGLLARELLKYSQVKAITLVELDKKVLDLFRQESVLIRLNKGALWDPRLKIVVNDAYYYIRNSTDMFDAVYLDLPAPVDYDLSKLYSREFYTLLKKRLMPGGFIVLDAPGMAEETVPVAFQDEVSAGLPTRMRVWQTLASTLGAAGFQSIVPFTSRLEEDNPLALKIFGTAVGDKEEARLTTTDTLSGEQRTVRIQGKEDVVRSMVRDHVLKMRAGFIMAWEEDGHDPMSLYQDFGVSYNVINPERYHLSLADGQMFTLAGQKGPVNFLFQPSLPLFEDWHKIRTAY